jgi:hypothetical protein
MLKFIEVSKDTQLALWKAGHLEGFCGLALVDPSTNQSWLFQIMTELTALSRPNSHVQLTTERSHKKPKK